MKNFSWSWSRFKNFRTCPKRHYEIDIAKRFVESKSEALIWGDQVHKAIAKRIADGEQLPVTMKRFEPWCENICDARDEGLPVKIENKLAMSKEFEPTSFFDGGTWFRCVVDVLIENPADRWVTAMDWKTGGKIQPEFEQLALSAQVIFANYPNVDFVRAIYVWLSHDNETTDKTYYRHDMAETWMKVLPQVRVMDEAHRTTTYPPNPSGLCIRYCPVTSCTYHGKGSR